jgi:hypothetical protein
MNNLFVQATNKCKQLLRQALVEINQIPHDVGPFAPTDTMNEQLQIEEEQNVSASAPPISSTKGSRARAVQGDDVPLPHFKRKPKATHTRRCTGCGQTGHKITTCGREVAPKRPRGRPVGSGRGRGRGRDWMGSAGRTDVDTYEDASDNEESGIADEDDDISDNNL